MGKIPRVLWLLLIVLLLINTSHSKLKFTNLECHPIDKDFATFPMCKIIAHNRSTNAVMVHIKLLQMPLTNSVINGDLRKRENGYKPFLYNITFDVCHFLKHRHNPIVNFVYNAFSDFTNANHTCPYNHDLWINKYPSLHLDNYLLKFLPMPNGDYAGFYTWYTDKKKRVFFRVFLSIS